MSGPTRWDWGALCLALVLSTAWCVSAATQLGATFDEPTYIAAGLDRWRTGRIGGLMRLGTMPLPVDVATLPLYVIERGRGVPFAITTDPKARPVDVTAVPEVLGLARAGTLVFWWLLLYYGWRLAWDLAGPWGGRLALVTLASEPNLLAHATLATTDVAVSACLVALVYRARIGWRSGWWRRIAVPAIWFALALLSKASALVFGPICLVAVAVEALAEDGLPARRLSGGGSELRQPLSGFSALRPACRDILVIAAAGIALTFLYCGSDWERDESFIAWASAFPTGPLRTALSWLADHLAIFSNAGEGLVQQIKHNVRGHGAYLLGRTYERAIWFYFPVALSIKLAATVLLAVLLVAVVRPRALRNDVLMSVAMLVCASVLFRVQIGIRLVLPVVALLMIGLSAAVVHCLASLPGVRARTLGVLATAAASLALVGTALGSWPNALAFTNALWGGTRSGYLLLSDSNYDWGQGLPELRRWQDAKRVASLGVWYWGTDPALSQGPWQPMALHALEVESEADLIAALRGRHLAASTTLVYGSVLADTRDRSPEGERLRRTTRELRVLLQSRTPVARTSTFLVYDFTNG